MTAPTSRTDTATALHHYQGLNFNPAAAVERQRDAIIKVERTGTEDVAGVETTHYVATFDTTAIARLQKTGSADARFVGDTVKCHFWLDDEMRTVKMALDAKMRVADRLASTTLEVVVTDYDKPVTITAPN